MAAIRNGIPDDARFRVVLPFTPIDRSLARFGIFTQGSTDVSPERMQEVFSWVKENCSGLVYHIECYLANQDVFRWVFFKNDTDAVHFKMRFC